MPLPRKRERHLAASFSLAPLRVAAFAGAGMALLGAFGVLLTSIEALTTRNILPGYASSMTVILLVSGVQAMILGLIGEYGGRTFLSANGKPHGTVRRVERNEAAEEKLT